MPKLLKISAILAILISFSGNSFALETDNNPEKPSSPKITVGDIDSANFKKVAIVQILNKITTKNQKLRLVVGAKTPFGSLIITAHKCWLAPIQEKPENKILIEITAKDDDKSSRLFYGWIFSSSQSASIFEHPVYDITALECTD